MRVVDSGASRAALIPCTRNQPAFPNGVSGSRLLERMRASLARQGVEPEHGEVRNLERLASGFRASCGEFKIEARSILVATGAVDRRPDVSEAFHQSALANGRFRYCPVCDGFEVIDRAVAVIGAGEHGMREAGFLRAYTSNLTLIAPDGQPRLDEDQRRKLAELGVRSVAGPARAFRLEPDQISLETAEGRLGFDAVYPALGLDARSTLAKSVGARLSDLGCMIVDAHQRTSVDRVYAAGDAVVGLDQINVAMSHGAIAATAIRNDLAGDSAR